MGFQEQQRWAELNWPEHLDRMKRQLDEAGIPYVELQDSLVVDDISGVWGDMLDRLEKL